MTISPVAPIRLSRDEFYEGKANIDLRKGFTIVSTMWAHPHSENVEQVIFDIGEDGKSPSRIQLFIDKDGSMLFRVQMASVRIPKTATKALTNRWVPIALSGQVKSGRLTMRFIADPDLEWSAKHEFKDRPLNYGKRMRIGNALSGGRGLELMMLDMAMWSAVIPKKKALELLQALRERPAAFGLEHGIQ